MSSDSLWRSGQLVLPVVTVFPPTHWCAGFRVKRAVCQEAVRLGRVVLREDAWLSTFTSPESVRELQQWDKTVSTNFGVKEIK